MNFKRATLFSVLMISLLLFSACAPQQEKAKITIVDEAELKNISTPVSTPTLNESSSNQSQPVVQETKKVEVTSDMTVLSVKENENVTINVSSVDEDGDILTYNFSSPLNSKGEWKTQYGDAGEYLIDMSANDGKNIVTQKFKIIVERVNVPPIFLELPQNITVFEGDRVSINALAKDPNGDKVTYSISDNRFASENGTFNWQTSYTDRGEYTAELTANDGELSTRKLITVKVKINNIAPELTVDEKVVFNEGETVVLKPTANDVNKDAITISLSNLSNVTKFTKRDDGSYAWLTNYTNHGTYDVEVRANDGEKTTTKVVVVVVQDVNLPPKITSIKTK